MLATVSPTVNLYGALYDEFIRQRNSLRIYEQHGTGSRFICPGHCGEDADWDVVCLADVLPQLGEPYCNADPACALFESIKFPTEAGMLNLIITAMPDFYRRFVMATHVSKWQRLVKREDRVKMFKAFLYDTVPAEETP